MINIIDIAIFIITVFIVITLFIKNISIWNAIKWIIAHGEKHVKYLDDNFKDAEITDNNFFQSFKKTLGYGDICASNFIGQLVSVLIQLQSFGLLSFVFVIFFSKLLQIENNKTS